MYVTWECGPSWMEFNCTHVLWIRPCLVFSNGTAIVFLLLLIFFSLDPLLLSKYQGLCVVPINICGIVRWLFSLLAAECRASFVAFVGFSRWIHTLKYKPELKLKMRTSVALWCFLFSCEVFTETNNIDNHNYHAAVQLKIWQNGWSSAWAQPKTMSAPWRRTEKNARPDHEWMKQTTEKTGHDASSCCCSFRRKGRILSNKCWHAVLFASVFSKKKNKKLEIFVRWQILFAGWAALSLGQNLALNKPAYQSTTYSHSVSPGPRLAVGQSEQCSTFTHSQTMFEMETPKEQRIEVFGVFILQTETQTVTSITVRVLTRRQGLIRGGWWTWEEHSASRAWRSPTGGMCVSLKSNTHHVLLGFLALWKKEISGKLSWKQGGLRKNKAVVVVTEVSRNADFYQKNYREEQSDSYFSLLFQIRDWQIFTLELEIGLMQLLQLRLIPHSFLSVTIKMRHSEEHRSSSVIAVPQGDFWLCTFLQAMRIPSRCVKLKCLGCEVCALVVLVCCGACKLVTLCCFSRSTSPCDICCRKDSFKYFVPRGRWNQRLQNFGWVWCGISRALCFEMHHSTSMWSSESKQNFCW